MTIQAIATDLHLHNMRLRMPFRFGIVTLTQCPHIFVRVLLDVDGRQTWGVAADMLPNKWFTKDADTYENDIADMLKVIRMACDIAVGGGKHASVFDLWERMYLAHQAWAGGWGHPPLLASFGTSLVERAIIDAFCQDQGVPFSRVLREDRLGLRLGHIHEELSGARPADLLPAAPLEQMTIRHTVGLTDPLTEGEIADSDRVRDGLPESLQACIRADGLTHFKIKLWGDAGRDGDRVRKIAEVISANAGNRFAFTLDGNENFKAVESFREFWMSLANDSALKPFLSRLLFVEQPLHRSIALSEEAIREFGAWEQRPPTIIDESDGSLSSARQAIEFGYAGTSHKNCKGVIKGIANACLLEHRRLIDPSRAYIQSAEDLTNIGPVALMQDLCVVANLGIAHAERNGQHYLKGMSMFPSDVQAAVLAAHPDLYRTHADGFATLRIESGVSRIESVVKHGFGVAMPFDPTQFTPMEKWTYASMAGPLV